ncbi:MAG: hypothetical protein Q8R92_19585 [Deltaproteobacteria bacterium]|nr:hypothetical protein [Deltaproteobacteria bacterium]
MTFEERGERIEIWAAADSDPWEALRWPTVRVLRYRQHQPTGLVVEAYWLTDLPPQRVSSPLVYGFAKSRWEIENEGFNDGKTRHGMEHLSHHHANSLLVGWLLTVLAATIERLYRLRYLHRGAHRPATSSSCACSGSVSVLDARPTPADARPRPRVRRTSHYAGHRPAGRAVCPLVLAAGRMGRAALATIAPLPTTRSLPVLESIQSAC